MKLIKKVMRRIKYEMRCLKYRASDQIERLFNSKFPLETYCFKKENMILGGENFFINLAHDNDSLKNSIGYIYEHRFTILSDSLVDINLKKFFSLEEKLLWAADLPIDAVDKYNPIDWHKDFHSGYRWNQNSFYLDIKVAPVPGADIKTPRELSRFQHLPLLALGNSVSGCEEFLLEVLDWIHSNPKQRGVNWACTMDISLRVINWIWGLKLFESEVYKYPKALKLIVSSIYDHAKHIEKNLDYYEECTGNHYLSDIAGLLYIGAIFPEFKESDRWLLFALQQLVVEMDRETYPDGVCHEGSTYYHRLVAEIFISCSALAERIPNERRRKLLDVKINEHKVLPPLACPSDGFLNLRESGQILPKSFYDKLLAMGQFTLALTKPNGLVPQFGDNDSGRIHKLNPFYEDVRDHAHLVASIGELLNIDKLKLSNIYAKYEAKLISGGIVKSILSDEILIKDNSSETIFPHAGIAVVKRGPAWLAVTCSPNGKCGGGGHNHNDKLSFELNIHGADIVVDGGCPAYTNFPNIRNAFRSTWAHSTVAVVGKEQDEFSKNTKSLFSLPEKCNPELSLDQNGVIKGSHTGYSKSHKRLFKLSESELVIEDHLPIDEERWLIFNLNPGVQVYDLESDKQICRWKMSYESGFEIVVTIDNVSKAKIGRGFFSLGYGVPVPCSKVSVQMNDQLSITRMCWKI